MSTSQKVKYKNQNVAYGFVGHILFFDLIGQDRTISYCEASAEMVKYVCVNVHSSGDGKSGVGKPGKETLLWLFVLNEEITTDKT